MIKRIILWIGLLLQLLAVFISKPHYVLDHWCNRLGQCTSYFCGVHSLKQALAKFNDIDISEYTLAKWAGTTTAGTSPNQMRTALKKFNKKYKTKYILKEVEFKSLGKNTDERFKALGKLIARKDTVVILHSTYKLKYGHYEVVRGVDTGKRIIKILNSLGTRGSSGAYSGYIEDRSYNTMVSYINAMSQPSVMIMTKS